MNRAAEFLVRKRKILLGLFLVLTIASLFLAGQVKVNYDLTKYLPDGSRMKEGTRLMEQEFGKEASSRLRVMIPGLSETEKEEVLSWLRSRDEVSGADWKPGEEYNRDGYSLYELTTEYDSHSWETAGLYSAVYEKYGTLGVRTGGDIHEANVPMLPPYVVAIAIGLVLLVLLVMCNSWFEPVIILVNIGIAVAVNIGTNVVFPDISEFTYSIVGIMQLVLSLDYSIILLNRYTQEKEKHEDNPSAMKAAIAAAFPAVAGSSLTTFAGLLCLAFMGFRLGADMGYALAKGVLISLVCIFTVLPSLILMSDRLIVKIRKKALRIPMGKCARFEYRGRIALLILLPVLLAGSYLLKNNTEILYMLQMNNPVDAVFEDHHSLVLLYETKDSGRIAEALAPAEEDEKVKSVTGYYNTLGKAYKAGEIAELFGEDAGLDLSMIRMVYSDKFSEGSGAGKSAMSMFMGSRNAYNEDWAMTPAELIAHIREHFLSNPLYSAFIKEDARKQIADAEEMIRENTAKLEGERYGRVILETTYPEDSEETREFLDNLSRRCETMLDGKAWLIGTSEMNREMAQNFDTEMNRITLISALAIFIVVALTFRSLVIPLVLVLTVQSGIYLTMAFIGLSGGAMFYLAILMVQCILMGATIDYAILYTSYYREERRTGDVPAAISGAYDGALHTILTSALIMIGAAGILGYVFANPAIGEICLTISRGAISATLIIVFVLPGVLAALDRFVRYRDRKGTGK